MMTPSPLLHTITVWLCIILFIFVWSRRRWQLCMCTATQWQSWIKYTIETGIGGNDKENPISQTNTWLDLWSSFFARTPIRRDRSEQIMKICSPHSLVHRVLYGCHSYRMKKNAEWEWEWEWTKENKSVAREYIWECGWFIAMHAKWKSTNMDTGALNYTHTTQSKWHMKNTIWKFTTHCC